MQVSGIVLCNRLKFQKDRAGKPFQVVRPADSSRGKKNDALTTRVGRAQFDDDGVRAMREMPVPFADAHYIRKRNRNA